MYGNHIHIRHTLTFNHLDGKFPEISFCFRMVHTSVLKDNKNWIIYLFSMVVSGSHILPIGWLHITYHTFREPETAIDILIFHGIPNKYPRDIRCIWGWLSRAPIPRVPPFSLWILLCCDVLKEVRWIFGRLFHENPWNAGSLEAFFSSHHRAARNALCGGGGRGHWEISGKVRCTYNIGVLLNRFVFLKRFKDVSRYFEMGRWWLLFNFRFFNFN